VLSTAGEAVAAETLLGLAVRLSVATRARHDLALPRQNEFHRNVVATNRTPFVRGAPPVARAKHRGRSGRPAETLLGLARRLSVACKT
jgi:hypothetical protein